MTANENLFEQIYWPSLVRRMLIGAAIALALIIVFLWGVEPKPEWGEYWKIRPLIVVSMAGAAGGAFTYLMKLLREKRSWNPFLTYVLGFLVCLIGLWMGTVLGLNGTLWN